MVKLNACINEVKTFKGIVNNVVKEPVSSSVKKKAILEKCLMRREIIIIHS